jgi:hypothetical protein
MSFDIFNPMKSVVAKGLEGKVITIYGSNNLGKTKQATRMEKPYYLGFEKGLRAISGIPFLPINKWSDFKKINKQLNDPKTLDRAKELYQTIIFDEVYTSALYCQDYICKKHGEETIGSGNGGFGLWKEYEKEFWTEIDKLLGSGYTLVFIAHAEETKEGKVIPKGDKRSIKPIIDNSDIVAYLSSNGVDEDLKVVNSSAWFAETDKFFARSRFDYIDTYLQDFTAENLERVIATAIERQEEAEGVAAVSYNDQKEIYQSEDLSYEELMEKVTTVINELIEADEESSPLKITKIIETHLGKGRKLNEASEEQTEMIGLILEDLKELLAE